MRRNITRNVASYEAVEKRKLNKMGTAVEARGLYLPLEWLRMHGPPEKVRLDINKDRIVITPVKEEKGGE